MYEKLIDIGLRCTDNNQPCGDCPYHTDFPMCFKTLIADLTEALMTIEAAHHLKQKLDSIQLVELRR